MINVKREGNQLLNADFETPMAYAVLYEGLTDKAKEDITRAVHYGSQMLDVYRSRRDNLHIANVMRMLEEMESIFGEFSRK